MEKALSKLFMDIESDVGTHAFCVMALDALKNALLQYRIKTKEDFDRQLMALFKLLQSTKPRYAILMDAFYKILDQASAYTSERIDVQDVIRKIDYIATGYQLEKLQLVQVAKSIDVENKNILIHDHSHSVHSILTAFKQEGRKFTVIVAEQNLEKTEDNIVFLHNHGIEYKVVPAYMLSHIEETIDMVFCGAVTYQQTGNFVMDPGSKPIISHFFLEKKPIYLFLTTSKFTLWPVSETQDIYAKTHRRRHHILTEIEYERLKFSHDRVPIGIINHVVTEKAIYTPGEFQGIFEEMFRKRAEKRKKYISDL